MRGLMIIVGIVLALALHAAPVGQADNAASDSVYAVAVDSEMPSECIHCGHCSDTAHQYGSCAGCAFTGICVQPDVLCVGAYTNVRAPFAHDAVTGHTLLPPVPPPLA
jgi:hypothetical protein